MWRVTVAINLKKKSQNLEGIWYKVFIYDDLKDTINIRNS